MYIQKVKVRNVRGFKEVDLDFTRPDGSFAGWTVLAGRNGSGKSSLLRAIALAIAGPSAARALCTTFAGWLRTGESRAEVSADLDYAPTETTKRPVRMGGSMKLAWEQPTEGSEPVLTGNSPASFLAPRRRSTARIDAVAFQSGSFNDRPQVEWIIERLQARGLRIWLPDWSIRPGESVQRAVKQALSDTSSILIFIGEGKSGLVDQAIEEAERRSIPVIPVLLKSAGAIAIPPVLGSYASVDTRRGQTEAISRLIWGITGDNPHLNDRLDLQNPPGWFLAGYGPYRRLTGHALDAQRLMEGPEVVARLVSLFREDSSLIESVTWLRDIYLRRLEKDPDAERLEMLVISLLKDGLMPDDVVVESIDSDGLWVRQRGVRLPLAELSDGYRTTAALVMDMVRQMYRCFGQILVDEEGAKSPIRILHEGIVLIDEVDLHLHVSWQKGIGFWLKRHFPNIQFIVTTHSPFVCQAADPRGLIRLPAPGEDRIAEHVSEELYNTVVNGSLDEAVLTDLFGLETPYSEQTEKLRERVGELEARLQAGEATPDEEEEFDRLSARLPQTLPSVVEQALRKLAADV